MKKSSLKTLCLGLMEKVPQCCEVFDCLRSSELEEFPFDLKYNTSLPVSVMTIYRRLAKLCNSSPGASRSLTVGKRISVYYI